MSAPQQPPPPPGTPVPAPPPVPAGGVPPGDPGNTSAVVALILGIVGLVTGFLILGPFAWWLGVAGKRNVDQGKTTQYRGLALAGQILGIIQTALMILAIITVIVIIIVAVATD